MFYREAGVFKTSYAADMAMMPLPSTRWAAVALGILFIGIAPAVCDEYTLSVLNLILIAVVGAIGLNILVGYTDQVSIGHGAFMSVGAYTAAHLITQLNAPFWIAVPAGGLMAAAIGTLVGIPSLRIKGLYLAIATLAAQLIIEWTINHVPWVSGGTQSTIQVGPPSVFGTPLTSAWQMYLFLMFFVILAMVVTQNLIRSRIGRAFIAIRDQDIAAEIIGINIFRYKLWAFAISSFYAGVTGVLYTYYLGIANYEQFQLDVSINFLAMVIIGGLGSTLGPVFGAIFVTLLPIVTRRVLESAGGLFFSASDLSAVIPSLRLAIFGALIIFFLVVEPEGLNRLWRNIRNYFRVWPFSVLTGGNKGEPRCDILRQRPCCSRGACGAPAMRRRNRRKS